MVRKQAPEKEAQVEAIALRWTYTWLEDWNLGLIEISENGGIGAVLSTRTRTGVISEEIGFIVILASARIWSTSRAWNPSTATVEDKNNEGGPLMSSYKRCCDTIIQMNWECIVLGFSQAILYSFTPILKQLYMVDIHGEWLLQLEDEDKKTREMRG